MSTTPEPVEPTIPADAEEETSPAAPEAVTPPEQGAEGSGHADPAPAQTPEAQPAAEAHTTEAQTPEAQVVPEAVADPAVPSGDPAPVAPPAPAAEAPATEEPAPATQQVATADTGEEATAATATVEPAAPGAPPEPMAAAEPDPPAAPGAPPEPMAAVEAEPPPVAATEDTPATDGPAAEDGSAEVPTVGASTAEAEPAEAEPAEGGKRRKKRKKGKGEAAVEQPAEQAAEQQKKRRGPEPAEVTARIGTSNDQALAYLANPDPKLSRLSKKVVEALLPDLHPVTGAALLGPAGFTRHLVASAATGRYRDLFVLWETFRRFPAEAKPELAERSIALSKAQQKLRTAVRIGLTGRSARLAEDIQRAEGLIWTWLREALVAHLPAVGARPAVASALLRRDASIEVPLPEHPDERWLAEAASARQHGPLAEPVEAALGANVHRLPATVDTLRLATVHYPERVAALVDRVDLDAPDIGAFLAWARDHGAAERLHGRIRDRVAAAAARDRADGLARWYAWRQRGVHLELPEALRTDSLEGFDLARPETAELAARLEARGIDLQLQQRLEDMARSNRQLAEKAYEAMVCAGLGVTLPETLKDNPVVNPGTRCPKCQAWTWVRPGHESRCPRPEAPAPEPQPDPFDFVAAEAGTSDQA